MKKWKKILISLITVFVLAILPGRIGNSAWHSLCYRGRSQDQFFQAYHDQGAEQITEDHRSQKRAENHLEEQQSEACNGICIRQAFCHQE